MAIDPSELWKHSLEKAKTPRKLPAAFETIHVSNEADELIEAHKQAAFATGFTEGEPSISRGYAHLNVTAESLYKYIESLEIVAGKPRTIIKRF